MRDTQLKEAEQSFGHKLTIFEDKEKRFKEQRHQVKQQLLELDNQTGADNQTHKAHQLERRYQDLGRKAQQMSKIKQLMQNRKRFMEAQEHRLAASIKMPTPSPGKGQKMPSGKGQKSTVDALKQKQLATTARASRTEMGDQKHPAEAPKPQPNKSRVAESKPAPTSPPSQLATPVKPTKPAAPIAQQHPIPSPSVCYIVID